MEALAPYMGPVAGVLALLYALYLSSQVMKEDRGNEKMREISDAIQEGAMAFLSREYRTLVIFVIGMAILIAVGVSPYTAICFIFGATLSATAGYVGLRIATAANSRTTQAATKGVAQALMVAFRGGSVMGMSVVGLGLTGLGISYLVFRNFTGAGVTPLEIINGFALGASSIALFARVGGGIYTKAADVGADLVGKVEAGIPEDDPRNPAVIADNVGDNVGDVAGMGADLFESYIGSIVAPMTLGAVLFAAGKIGAGGVLLPLALAAFGIIASIIGTFFVRASEDSKLHSVLNRGTYSAGIITMIGSFFLVQTMLGADQILYAVAIVAGIIAGAAIGFITEVYTSDHYKYVKEIAAASTTGPATNILAGISIGMASTAIPVLVICIAIFASYAAGEAVVVGGGIYAIGLAALGMLSTTGIVVGVDAYGPIADNAGGISEMAGLGPEVRKITDNLDSVGNTTAAIAKGFAIGSAALTALALFQAYSQAVATEGASILVIDINDVRVIVGLFIGAMYPFLFSAMAISAVSRAAAAMIEEVRRQFREIKGLMEGTAKPDYARCVDISTASALKEMIIPGTMTVLTPIVVGLILGPEALGGLLAGALATGFLMAIFMANAGGAWDNAKKYVEGGAHGGKGTDAHAAAVTGDTVGDPFKDTAGPSMNILIKVMTIVALVFAPLFAQYGPLV